MIRVRTMTRDDVPLGMRLKRHVGWNQTEADWLRLLELQPDGCFVADLDRIPAATLTTSRYGPVAWIAMVLVDLPARGRGLAKALMMHALDSLSRQGVATVRLDATPVGRPLYERFGFVGEYALARYDGALAPAAAPEGVLAYEADQLDGLTELDRRATGTERRRLIEHLAATDRESVRVVRREANVAGVLFTRPGSEARQMGPWLIPPGTDAGGRLWSDACARYAGQRVFVDIPTDHAEAISLARAAGLAEGRPFLRMRRGEPLPEERELLWAGCGPELG